MSNIAPTDETSLQEENRSLRKRVDELERTISAIEQPKNEAIVRTAADWWKIAIFVILLMANLFSSYLVLRDRWLENRVNIPNINQFWWDTPFLKSLPYPQYFLFIFLSSLLVILLVSFWRDKPLLVFSNLTLGNLEPADEETSLKKFKQGHYFLIAALIVVDLSAIWMIVKGRIPGWELLLALVLFLSGLFQLDTPKVSLRETIQSRGKLFLDAALFVIALSCALYATFGENKPNLIFYLLLIVASVNLFKHRKEIHLLFWICIASLVALTWNIDSWQYVVIGDEYSFFTEILNILDNRTPWQLVNNTFNGNFVYGTHPYFSSYIQNLFMKLFDNHSFGWRFSNPVLVVSSLPLYYYFFKTFVPKKTAITIVILLGFSHYLLSFGKIGYNNLQAFFIMGALLACFTWALTSMKTLAFCVTGLVIGLCFYLYPAALYVIPLPVIGFLFYMPPTKRETQKLWAWMVISAAMLIYPLFIQPKYWEAKIAGTFLYTDVSSSAATLFQNILRNVMFSAFSYLYIPEQTHYVSIGYLDLLSSVFVIIGFVSLLKAVLQRNKSALFLTVSFLAMFIVVGATHGRNFPTATRMFLLLPWYALFTALGLEWCLGVAKSFFRINVGTVGTILVGAIVILNLYQTYVVDVRNMAQYHTLAPMFVKTVREINANKQLPAKSYAFVAPLGWNTNGMEIIQRAYLVPDSPRQLINLPMSGNLLPDSAQELVSQRDIVVIVKADLGEEQLTSVGVQLLSWGKFVCEIRNEKGTLQFQLWHSGDLGWLCL